MGSVSTISLLVLNRLKNTVFAACNGSKHSKLISKVFEESSYHTCLTITEFQRCRRMPETQSYKFSHSKKNQTQIEYFSKAFPLPFRTISSQQIDERSE